MGTIGALSEKNTLKFRYEDDLLLATYISVDGKKYTSSVKLRPGYSVQIEKVGLKNDIVAKIRGEREATRVRLLKQLGVNADINKPVKKVCTRGMSGAPTKKAGLRKQALKLVASNTNKDSITFDKVYSELKQTRLVELANTLYYKIYSTPGKVVITSKNIGKHNVKDYEHLCIKYFKVEYLTRQNMYRVFNKANQKSVVLSSVLSAVRIAVCYDLYLNGRLENASIGAI